MKYRKESGKAVTHPKRMLRRLRAKARALSPLGVSSQHLGTSASAVIDQIDVLEASIRAPQGGRRHGGVKRKA